MFKYIFQLTYMIMQLYMHVFALMGILQLQAYVRIPVLNGIFFDQRLLIND